MRIPQDNNYPVRPIFLFLITLGPISGLPIAQRASKVDSFQVHFPHPCISSKISFTSDSQECRSISADPVYRWGITASRLKNWSTPEGLLPVRHVNVRLLWSWVCLDGVPNVFRSVLIVLCPALMILVELSLLVVAGSQQFSFALRIFSTISLPFSRSMHSMKSLLSSSPPGCPATILY